LTNAKTLDSLQFQSLVVSSLHADVVFLSGSSPHFAIVDSATAEPNVFFSASIPRDFQLPNITVNNNTWIMSPFVGVTLSSAEMIACTMALHSTNISSQVPSLPSLSRCTVGCFDVRTPTAAQLLWARTFDLPQWIDPALANDGLTARPLEFNTGSDTLFVAIGDSIYRLDNVANTSSSDSQATLVFRGDSAGNYGRVSALRNIAVDAQSMLAVAARPNSVEVDDDLLLVKYNEQKTGFLAPVEMLLHGFSATTAIPNTGMCVFFVQLCRPFNSALSLFFFKSPSCSFSSMGCTHVQSLCCSRRSTDRTGDIGQCCNQHQHCRSRQRTRHCRPKLLAKSHHEP
jgi:hypothetical protein